MIHFLQELLTNEKIGIDIYDKYISNNRNNKTVIFKHYKTILYNNDNIDYQYIANSLHYLNECLSENKNDIFINGIMIGKVHFGDVYKINIIKEFNDIIYLHSNIISHSLKGEFIAAFSLLRVFFEKYTNYIIYFYILTEKDILNNNLLKEYLSIDNSGMLTLQLPRNGKIHSFKDTFKDRLQIIQSIYNENNLNNTSEDSLESIIFPIEQLYKIYQYLSNRYLHGIYKDNMYTQFEGGKIDNQQFDNLHGVLNILVIYFFQGLNFTNINIKLLPFYKNFVLDVIKSQKRNDGRKIYLSNIYSGYGSLSFWNNMNSKQLPTFNITHCVIQDLHGIFKNNKSFLINDIGLESMYSIIEPEYKKYN